jgi:hypothetical protein
MVGCTEPATAALNNFTLQVDKRVKENYNFCWLWEPYRILVNMLALERDLYDPRAVVNVRDM